MKNSKHKIASDDYELGLMESLHSQEWLSVPEIENEKKRYQNIAISTIKDMQAIEINIKKEDIETIQKRSSEIGIPFQTLLSALIHNFATGKIKLKFE